VAQHIIAGGFSGIFTATVATPGERVKCLMQIQRESKTTARYSSSFDCAVKLYKEGGIRNVCKGAYATLLRDVISGAGFFGIYYWVRPKLRSRNASKEDISIPAVLIAGGLAGAGCSIACLPADVVKSRVQTAPEGTRTNIATIFVRLLKEGGIRSLYKGVTPIMLRGFIGNAGGFLGYEYTIKVLNKLLQ
jgi:solute carrier family 25 carnitine/acylcarnitine transporter 20/29